MLLMYRTKGLATRQFCYSCLHVKQYQDYLDTFSIYKTFVLLQCGILLLLKQYLYLWQCIEVHKPKTPTNYINSIEQS